jgi:hypothetical protein
VKRHLLVGALIAWVLASGSALAASGRSLGLDEMIDLAEDVVVADVGESTTRWQGRMIVTDTTVHVREALKGAASGDVTVTQLGGTAVHPRLGVGVTMQASTFTSLAPGESVVLFLDHRGGRRSLVGAQQGKLLLQEAAPVPGGATSPPAVAVGPAKARVLPGEGAAVGPQGMTLDELRTRVRGRTGGTSR